MRDALVIGFDLPNSRGVDDALAKPVFVALRELSPLVRPPPPVNPDVNLLSMDVMLGGGARGAQLRLVGCAHGVRRAQ
jgi:hypothetical protein